ncbi:MAG TPA: hypothetical protein VJ866_10865 [Pyrinomonadaceae bacterium]|nr:hypothetical protein [Pyrinomonadaceae bacterium]
MSLPSTPPLRAVASPAPSVPTSSGADEKLENFPGWCAPFGATVRR